MLLTMRNVRRFTALALGLGALAAPAVASAQEAGQTESGFALGASLGARYGFLVSGGNIGGTTVSLPGSALQAGLFAGYKTGRILIGAGMEFTNYTTSTSQTTLNVSTSTTTSDSNFLIGPEFEAALLRTADSRVELIADLALHFGHEFVNTTITPAPPPNNTPTDSNFLLSYRLGAGVRFWAHPHFALQAVTGFGGTAYFDLPVNNDPNNSDSVHGIFASFGALGVF